MKRNDGFENILKSFNENNNSHIFLIETNSVSMATNDLKNLIIEILKVNDDNIKNQIMDESYIDINIVRPENNLISKESISILRNYLKTKSVIFDKKFYIIENCELMNEYSSNMLLKQIEEPEGNIIGFLVTENINNIISTIKSRCHHIITNYEISIPENKDADYKLIAHTFLDILKKKNLFEFHSFKKDNIDKIEDCGKFIECLLLENLSLYNTSNNYIYMKLCNSISHFYSNNRKNMNSNLLLEELYINLKKVI